MDWSHKVTMIEMANRSQETELLAFVHTHVADFDHQAWEMFLTAITITPEKIHHQLDFWLKLQPHLVGLDDKLDLRSAIRLGYLQSLIIAATSEEI